MRLTRMAWRNLSRSRRRTLITSFSVAFGVLLAVTFTASGDYSYTSMINTSAAMGFGHLTVEPPGYNDTPTIDKTVGRSEAVRRQALALPEVRAALARITGQAMFAAGARNSGAMFLAIDPRLESGAENLFIRSLVEGRLFDDPAGRGIVVGVQMARKLNLRPGRKVIYTMTDKQGGLASGLSRVSGIFRTGDDQADSSVVLLPIDRLRQVLGYDRQEASLVALFLTDQRRARAVAKKVAALPAARDLEVLTFRETQAEMAGIISLDRLFNYLLQFLIGLLIAAGIMDTMLMSVVERHREFGMMIAIGMEPRRLIGLVLVESLWIGIIGIGIGALVTVPWYLYMSSVGLDLGRFVGDNYSAGGVLVDPVLRFRLYPENGLIIGIVLFGLTLVAGLYPACRAGRVQPVESLKQLW